MQSTRFPFEDFEAGQESTAPATVEPSTSLKESNDAAANENPSPPPPPKPEKTVTLEELEQAKKAAFEEGKSAGLSEGKALATEAANAAQEQINKRISASLDSLNIQLATLSDSIEKNDIKQLVPLIHTLALSIAQKMTAKPVKEEASKEIEAQIEHTMSVMFDLPSLVIYVHPDLEQHFKEKVEELAVKSSFRGKLTVLADTALGETDCRLDWKDGFSEISKQGLWKSVEQALGTTAEKTDTGEVTAATPETLMPPEGEG